MLLFILVGDHGPWGYEKEKNLKSIENNARTFAILKHPSLPTQTVQYPTSHIDIPASIIALMGWEEDKFLGVPVFEEERPPILHQMNQRNSSFISSILVTEPSGYLTILRRA